MKKLNLFLLVLFICNCPVVSGYAFFDRDIRLLTMQDGLADNTITSIYKDRDGFMWFGTNNGLSRYDGKLIKNFSSSPAYMYVSEIVEMSDRYLGVIAGILYIVLLGRWRNLYRSSMQRIIVLYMSLTYYL
jgi:ligand-binding sensor domain-containing protein